MTIRICVCAAILMTGVCAEAAPRYYFSVQHVRDDSQQNCPVVDAAKAIFLAELGRHPEVVVDVSAATEKNIVRYNLDLRLTRCHSDVQPPAKGKVYRVLMADVKVAIDAEHMVTKQMALAGEGDAQIGTEISNVKETERVALLREALTDAVKQAVTRSIEKLTKSPKLDGSKKKKKRKK